MSHQPGWRIRTPGVCCCLAASLAMCKLTDGTGIPDEWQGGCCLGECGVTSCVVAMPGAHDTWPCVCWSASAQLAGLLVVVFVVDHSNKETCFLKLAAHNCCGCVIAVPCKTHRHAVCMGMYAVGGCMQALSSVRRRVPSSCMHCSTATSHWVCIGMRLLCSSWVQGLGL